MTVNLSPLAGAAQQFLDNNGVILSGGKIYTYLAGTTTPAITYTSADAGAQHTNPIILDSAGRVPGGEIWLTSGVSYKFIIQTSTGVLLGTYDDIRNITASAMSITPSGYTTATNVQTAFDNLGSSTGAGYVGFLQSGTNAVSRPALSKMREIVSVKDFGATGNGVTDDAPYIRTAITYCQTNFATLYFPPGNYAIGTTINLAGNPITLMGEAEAIWQRGSTLTATTLTWIGATTPMFTLNSSEFTFIGFNVQNKTFATDFLYLGTTQRIRLKRMSFVVGTGAKVFSRSIIFSAGNRIGYSEFTQIYCLAAAPKFIYIDGQGTPNGITPFTINGRSVFESSATQAMTVIYVKDEGIDQITISGCTFNQQGGQELTIIDTTDTPLNPTIGSLTFSGNEWDNAAASAANRMMRLTNVRNFICEGNQMQCGGTPTALIELVNSNLASLNGNYVSSLAGPIVNADSNSSVNVGLNILNYANSRGALNATAQGIVDVAWTAGGVSVFAGNKTAANRHTVYRVSPTSGAAWTWSTSIAVSGVGYATIGQIITIMIKNASGGAILAGTPSATYFKVSAAPVAPANGFSRSYTFVWDGTYWVELYRGAADVPN